MISNLEANHYARGLLGAVELPQLDAVSASLADLAKTLGGHAELVSVLRNSAIPTATRIGLVDSLVSRVPGSPPVVAALLRLLTEQGHFHLLATVAAAFDRLAAEARGITRAEVRFARTPDSGETRAVADALEKAVGSRVEVHATVDAELLGGFVARVGDRVFDGSIARQLERLRAALLSG